MATPVGPMIGHKIGLGPVLIRYSVNSLPSISTVTPRSCFLTENSAASAEAEPKLNVHGRATASEKMQKERSMRRVSGDYGCNCGGKDGFPAHMVIARQAACHLVRRRSQISRTERSLCLAVRGGILSKDRRRRQAASREACAVAGQRRRATDAPRHCLALGEIFGTEPSRKFASAWQFRRHGPYRPATGPTEYDARTSPRPVRSVP